MYSMEEIFARLQNGETAEKIANEMADNINAAVAKMEEEKIKENLKAHAAEEAQKAANHLNALLDIYELTDERLTGDDVLELMESVKTLKTNLEGLIPQIEKVRVKTPDAKIDDFLKGWGLK